MNDTTGMLTVYFKAVLFFLIQKVYRPYIVQIIAYLMSKVLGLCINFDSVCELFDTFDCVMGLFDTY